MNFAHVVDEETDGVGWDAGGLVRVVWRPKDVSVDAGVRESAVVNAWELEKVSHGNSSGIKEIKTVRRMTVGGII